MTTIFVMVPVPMESKDSSNEKWKPHAHCAVDAKREAWWVYEMWARSVQAEQRRGQYHQVG